MPGIIEVLHNWFLVLPPLDLGVAAFRPHPVSLKKNHSRACIICFHGNRIERTVAYFVIGRGLVNGSKMVYFMTALSFPLP